MDSARCLRDRDIPSGDPRQKRGAQGHSRLRAAFLWDTFLWPRKEKYLARGCENPHSTQPSHRDSISTFNRYIALKKSLQHRSTEQGDIMNHLIIQRIRTFRGYAYETAGVLNGFFAAPEAARACGYEIRSLFGAEVQVCGCQLTVWP